MTDKLKAAILGATGLVGQTFVKLLSSHPLFEITFLAASEKRVGKKYGDEVKWVLDGEVPEEVKDLALNAPDPDVVSKSDVDVVFSALPSSVAAEIEVKFARKGFTVISNASPMRLDPDVPLIIPEVNWEHIGALRLQKQRRGWSGAIVKNSNCTTAILVLSLKPLQDVFGVKRVLVTTMQALSGAGYGGVPSIAIMDNIIPYIEKEEWKVMNETKKILGRLSNGEIKPANLEVIATTTRVPVIHGHLEVVYVETIKEVDVEEAIRAWENFKAYPQEIGAWMAPPRPVIVRRDVDRPQPRLDRDAGRGMAVTVGRASKFGDNLLRYIVLGHNLIRGAAGNTILVAELMAREGLI